MGERTPDQAIREELGRRLRGARAYLGWSQARVKSDTGISTSRLSRIENGQDSIELEELRALAELYHEPLADLLYGLVSLNDSRRSDNPGKTDHTDIPASDEPLAVALS